MGAPRSDGEAGSIPGSGRSRPIGNPAEVGPARPAINPRPERRPTCSWKASAACSTSAPAWRPSTSTPPTPPPANASPWPATAVSRSSCTPSSAAPTTSPSTSSRPPPTPAAPATTWTPANGASGIDHYWIKAETALDNDEAWVKVSQTAASEVVIVGATYGTQQKLVVIQVGADQLADGYGWISVNVACTTATSQLLTVLYLPYDLAVQRTPANRPNLLRPGAANV
jgi:hypothetical protein